MPSPAAPLLTDLLRQVSRSFYLTLRVLPAAVRTPISLAYLLARATDTVADTELVPVDRRLEALRRLRGRLQGGDGDLAFGALAQAQGEPAERVLLERVEEALAALELLAVADRDAVRTVLDVITGGQELDLVRFGQASADRLVALPDEAALDDYTYRVAGCVGEFWTRVCVAHLFAAPVGGGATFGQCGVRFGQGLQLVNILRDLPRDLRQGRCYLPQDGLAALGLEARDLLNPASDERLRPLYNRLLNRAHDHLAAGWDYTNRVPWSCPRVRLACAWPVLIGVRTLALLRGRNPLDPDRRHKVSRAAVRAMMLRSVLSYPVPPLWRELWRESGGMAPGKPAENPLKPLPDPADP